MIEPRQRWVPGVADLPSTIPPALRLEEGRALCVYGDGGWGSVVRQARYHDHRVPDELIGPTVDLVRAWAPDPPPAWVTWIPSSRDSDLVADFARRLAAELHLRAVDTVTRVRQSAPQNQMENSAQQLANVYGAFTVNHVLPDGPVLLIDDTFDSRWTLTVVGAALREAGSGPVYPFVLAKAM